MAMKHRRSKRIHKTSKYHITYDYNTYLTKEEAEKLTYEMILRGIEYEQEIIRNRRRRDLYVPDH